MDPTKLLSYWLPKILGHDLNVNTGINIDGNLLVFPTTVVTAAYQIVSKDNLILANATGGVFNVTLPDATLPQHYNRHYSVKKTDSSANAVTVNTLSSQTIDGASSSSLSAQYQDITVISDGTNWQVVQSSSSSSGLPLTGGTLTGALAIQSTSANALAVGANGATNPVLQIDASTASVVTGIKIKGAISGGGVSISAISSSAAEDLKLDALGVNKLQLQTVATGNIVLGSNITVNDNKSFVLGSSSGTKFGTATTQKLAFYNSSPIVQPSAVGTATGYAAGSTAVTFHSDDTYTGNVGATAYTLNGVVAALKNLGLIAA